MRQGIAHALLKRLHERAIYAARLPHTLHRGPHLSAPYSRPHAQAMPLSSNRAVANMSARGRGQPDVCIRRWPDPPGALTKLQQDTN